MSLSAVSLVSTKKQKRIIAFGKNVRARAKVQDISALLMICEYPVSGGQTGYQAISYGDGDGFALMRAICTRYQVMGDECDTKWALKVLRAIMALDGHNHGNSILTDEFLMGILRGPKRGANHRIGTME